MGLGDDLLGLLVSSLDDTVLYEACKYIGIVPDLYDPIEEDVKAYLRGE